MIEKIIQLLANPSSGVARDTSVKAGNTVYVNTNGITVPAVAVNDMTTSEVAVVYSEKDNTYYAVAGSNPQLLNEQTNELDRARGREDIVLLPFLVYVFDDLRYDDNKETLPFDFVSTFGTNETFIYYDFGDLFTTQNHQIYIYGRSLTGGFDDVKIQRYQNGVYTEFDENDTWFLLHRNYSTATARAPYRQWTDRRTVKFVIFGAQTVESDPFKQYILTESGDSVDQLRSDNTIVTAPSTVIYTYGTAGSVSVSSVINARIFGSNAQGHTFDSQGSGGDRSDIVGLGLAVGERNYVGTATFVPSTIQPGGGAYSYALIAPDWSSVYTSAYTYSSAGTGFSYDFLDMVTADNSKTLSVTIGDPDPGELAVSWSGVDTSTHDETEEEEVTGGLVAGDLGLDTGSLTKITGSYRTYRKWTKFTTQTRSSTGLTDQLGPVTKETTRDYTVSHTTTFTREYNHELNGTFTFNSYTFPVRFFTTGSQPLLSKSTTYTINGVEREGVGSITMIDSTASQVFFPDGSPSDVIETAGTETERNYHLGISGINGGWLKLTDDTASCTTTASVDNSSIDIIASSPTSGLFFTAEVSATMVHTATLTYRVGGFEPTGAIEIDTIYYDNDTTVAGLNFAKLSPRNRSDSIEFSFASQTVQAMFGFGQDPAIFGSTMLDNAAWQNTALIGTSLFTRDEHYRKFNTSLIEFETAASNIDFEHALIFHQEGGLGTVNLSAAEDSLFIKTGAPSILGNIITISVAEAYDRYGYMSITTNMITSVTFRTQTTTSDGGDTFDVSSAVTGTGGSKTRKSINAYIGDEFYVFDRDTKMLHEATLTTVTDAGTASNFTPRRFTFDFVINSSVEMKAGTFFLPEQSDGSVAISKNNLASMFMFGRDFWSGVSTSFRFPKHLTIRGDSLFLAYPESDDDTGGDLTRGFVHKFKVVGGKLIFDSEVEVRIFDDSIAKDAGRYKQFIDRVS